MSNPTIGELVNADGLRKILGESGFREFIYVVVEEGQSVFQSLAEPLATQDWEVIWKLAHKLKGICGGAGATDLTDSIAELQEAIQQKNLPAVTRLHGLIQDQLQTLDQAVKQYLANQDTP